MDNILEEDESSIECISDGDFIIIIEDRYYPDDEYFLYLKEKNFENDENINIVLISDEVFKRTFFGIS